MTRRSRFALDAIRILYALFWLSIALAPVVANVPFPRQPTQDANAPLAIIVPFNALLARQAGPWILVVLVHVVLLIAYRTAYVPMWSYRLEVQR
jgi:hypothetical protein